MPDTHEVQRLLLLLKEAAAKTFREVDTYAPLVPITLRGTSEDSLVLFSHKVGASCGEDVNASPSSVFSFIKSYSPCRHCLPEYVEEYDQCFDFLYFTRFLYNTDASTYESFASLQMLQLHNAFLQVLSLSRNKAAGFPYEQCMVLSLADTFTGLLQDLSVALVDAPSTHMHLAPSKLFAVDMFAYATTFTSSRSFLEGLSAFALFELSRYHGFGVFRLPFQPPLDLEKYVVEVAKELTHSEWDRIQTFKKDGLSFPEAVATALAI